MDASCPLMPVTINAFRDRARILNVDLRLKVNREKRRKVMNEVISKETMEVLPATVKNQLAKMPEELQYEFVEEFNRKFKPRSVATASFMAFLGLHYLYYNRIVMFLLFVFTGGGFGLWWLMIWIRSGSIAKEYNQEMAKNIAIDVLKEIKILNA